LQDQGSISRTFFSMENWVSAENSMEFFMKNFKVISQTISTKFSAKKMAIFRGNFSGEKGP
jgi:hypothetical protein